MRVWILFCCLFGVAFASESKRLAFEAGQEIAKACVSNCYCAQPMYADDIPPWHVVDTCDEYFTGYIQALIDINYYEFQVRVISRDQIIYVFNLPCNSLIANSILCFIYNIPCVRAVQQVNCCPGEFLNYLACTDPQSAHIIECSCAYRSICDPCACCSQIHAIWLPQNTLLFQPLIADPRQVMNAAALRFNDNAIGKHVGAVSFGDDFIIIRMKDIFWWRGDMDLGVEAGIFAVFDLDHPEACLVNTDFFVAALATYAIDNWSYRFRLWHLSSHLGDEFILYNINDPDFERCNLSDNGVDLFASFYPTQAIRLYAGAGYIFYRDKTFPEEPFYLEGGSEIRVFGCRDCFNRLYVQPFLAMHFRSWQEHQFAIDQTYVLGVEWSKLQGIGRKARVYFEYHIGFSKEGQFVRERCDYIAVKVNYGF